ncbi:hypothetical protein [Paralcaligenes ureilyticus]|nr:hypothetical protein [Paralcaligenes ureilyticus]
MADNKPKFSAGMVVAVITVVFALAFGAIIVHGQNMISQQESGSRS